MTTKCMVETFPCQDTVTLFCSQNYHKLFADKMVGRYSQVISIRSYVEAGRVADII